MISSSRILVLFIFLTKEVIKLERKLYGKYRNAHILNCMKKKNDLLNVSRVPTQIVLQNLKVLGEVDFFHFKENLDEILSLACVSSDGLCPQLLTEITP